MFNMQANFNKFANVEYYISTSNLKIQDGNLGMFAYVGVLPWFLLVVMWLSFFFLLGFLARMKSKQ